MFLSHREAVSSFLSLSLSDFTVRRRTVIECWARCFQTRSVAPFEPGGFVYILSTEGSCGVELIRMCLFISLKCPVLAVYLFSPTFRCFTRDTCVCLRISSPLSFTASLLLTALCVCPSAFSTFFIRNRSIYCTFCHWLAKLT